MPLVKPEVVAPFAIVDERLHDHLRHAEQLRSRHGFRDYISQFGFYDLGELTDAQMFALVAARNTAPLIDLLRIPRGRDTRGVGGHATYDLFRRKTSLGPGIQAFLASSPSSDQEWEVLRDPEDIPEAIPEDLLLRRLAPQEFLRRLTEGELLRSAWIQDEIDDTHQTPTETPDTQTRRRETASQDDARPYGYLLLDASESMGTARDRRDEVARGLALAFLLSQFDSGNPTVLHLFRHELSPQLGGEGRPSFESAVAAILAHSHEGMTNLQGALKLLTETMTARQARVDIVLITDGVTRLTDNPVGDSHLHTFLVGVRPEEFDAVGATQYQESLLKLKSWSDFMFRIEPSVMDQASVPRRQDVLDVARLLYGIEDEWASCASAERVKRIQIRLWNVHKFIERYRSHNAEADPEVDEANLNIMKAIEKYGRADSVEVARQNASQWTPVDRELMLSIEMKEQSGVLVGPSLGVKWRVKVKPQEFNDVFALILKMLRALAEKLKRRKRRR